MRRVCQVNKPRRLLAINSLIKSDMKESVLDIELMNMPKARNSKTEDNVNGGGFDD